MKFTGERFIPEQIDGNIATEHLQRYRAVLELVEGKSVLDAACGEGYGSSILASAACQVVGVDIDAEAVGLAQIKYHKKNLEYRCASVTEIPLPDASVDVVVSFETIEHIDAAMQKAFLKEIKRVLKPDGLLIMSTPDKNKYSEEPQQKNHYHVKEFYREEFKQFLQEYFAETKFYLQGIIPCPFKNFGLITPEEAGEQRKLTLLSEGELDNDNYEYLIAVCSQKKVPRSDSLLTLMPEENTGKVVVKLYQDRGKGFNEIDKMAVTARENVAKKSLQVRFELEKAAEILQMRFDPIEGQPCSVKILGIHTDIGQVKLDFVNAELKSSGEAYLLDLDPRITIHGDFKDATYLELEYEFKGLPLYDFLCDCLEKNSRVVRDEYKIAELEKTVCNQERHIELLLQSDRELSVIKASRFWSVMKAFWKIRDGLLPRNTKRRLAVKIIWKLIRMPAALLGNLNPMRLRKVCYYLKTEGFLGLCRRIDEYLQDIRVEDMTLDLVAFREIKHLGECEKISFPAAPNPQVSIIIPVYNQFSYTYHCLQSVLRNSGSISYEILIANDCSTDLTTQIEEVVENITVITNAENLHFLKNCNHAAQFAKGKYLLFLNNDTQVQKNWLAPLVDLMERDETIGMTGSKLVYRDGRLQEAGGILWQDASAWNYGRLAGSSQPEYNYVKEADYISGASLMISQKLWKEIGGFDERYAPAYCEDSDLAFEVRKRGYKVMYQPQSVVVHFEGVSNGTDLKSGTKSYQVENQKKFHDKWQVKLQEEHYPNGMNVFLARDRTRNKKCVLVIDHYVPQYDKDAGSRTVFQYLKLLAAAGYNVKFIGDNFYRSQPYTDELQQLGIEVLYGAHYAENWKSWIKNNAAYLDVVFINRPHIAEKYIGFVKENTRAKIIYYGHDLHFLREQREAELTGDPFLLESAEKWKKTEIEVMRKADVAYYPSQVEVEEIAKIDAGIKAKVLPPYIFEQTSEPEYNYNERKDIMFVGGFKHRPNVDAVKWFHEAILPLVLQQNRDIKIYVLGSNPPEEIQKLQGDNFIVTGFVSDEKLQEFYQTCRLDIVPLRYGAGIKGKVVEAMNFSIPVITTSVGAEGIKGAGQILCIKDLAEDFAAAILELYDNPAKLEEMSKLSGAYIKENFSPASALQAIREEF